MTPINKLSRILSFTFILCIFSILAKAQTPDVLEVSYQEVTTKIQSQTADENGNTYYAGKFKGALLVDGDTLAYGLGGEDYFLLKKSNQGAVEWVIPFGSVQNDPYIIHISWIQGNLFLHFGLPTSFTFKNLIIEPLFDQGLTYSTIKLDSAGNILWMKRSNFWIKEFHDIDGGSIAAISYDISEEMNPKIENETIYNLNGQKSTLIIKITRDGNFLSCYPLINTFNTNAHIGVITRSHVQNNQFYFLLSPGNLGVQTGKNELNFNGSIITLQFPSSNSVLVKTDTSFNVKSHKILNPSGPGFYSGATTAANRIQFSDDSTSLHLFANTGTYTLDGYNESLNGKYGIAILDTNLNTTQFKIILENQGVIHCNHIQEYNGAFYVFGTLIGKITNMGGPGIPEIIQTIHFGNNKTIQFDVNGIYKSFILKVDKNLNYLNHAWIGDHTIQESILLFIEKIQFINNKILFYQSTDNSFNPWEMNTDLDLVKGGSKPSVDQADYIEKVAYFSNKTKLLLGLANGLTAFDTNPTGIIKSNGRRDFFYAVIDSNQNIIKYNRVYGSMANCIISQLRKQNGKVSFILNLTSARNRIGFNYYKLENDSASITNNFQKLFITIDSVGNVSSYNFENTPIGAIIDFDYFDNGDLAVITDNNTIAYNLNGKIFPANNGFYIARMTQAFQITNAVKIFQSSGPAVTPRQVAVLKGSDDFHFIVSPTIPANGGINYFLILARGNNNNTAQYYTNPLPSASSTKYYHLLGKANFTTFYGTFLIGPFTIASGASLANIGERAFIVFSTSPINQDNLQVNGKTVLATPNAGRTIILGIDDYTLLKYTYISPAPPNQGNSLFVPNSIKNINNHLYLSGGLTNNLKFGALNIPYKGEGDGLILKMDNALNMVQYYSVASIYSDFCSDIDFYSDSSILIAYRSQGTATPRIGLNQASVLQSASGILPSDLEESGYVSQFSAAMAPSDYLFTIKNGSWHDASIWNTGIVPKSTDRVFVRHKVQVLQATECYQIFVDPTSDLKVGDGIKLTVTGMVAN